MVYITKNSKDKKFDDNYVEILKSLSVVLDGTETDDTKKKSKKLATLLEDGKKLEKEKTDKELEIGKKVDETKTLKNISQLVEGAKREKQRLHGGTLPAHTASVITDKSGFVADDDASDAFRGKKSSDGTASTNRWRTNGWDANITAYYPNTIADNLYTITGQSFKTTEDQAVKTIARVVYELGKLDKTDLTGNVAPTDATNVGNWYDSIKVQSDAIELMNKKSATDATALPKKTWDLPQTYTQEQAIGAGTARSVALNFTHLFSLLDKLDDATIDKLKQDNITKTETWKIAKQGDAYTDDELKNNGIFVQDNSKTFLYKTVKRQGVGYVRDEYSVNVANGLKDWVKLLKSIFPDAPTRTKLITSFTNSPTQHLFDDLRGQAALDANFATNFRLPESESEIDTLIADLKMDKAGSASRLGTLQSEISAGNTEIANKKAEIAGKSTEVQTLITEILTKKREALATHNISKGFAKTTTEDNRRDSTELSNIERLLLEIRYLENDGDATANSSKPEEDATLTTVQDILERTAAWGASDCFLINAFKSIGNNDNSLAIQRIQAGKYTDKDGKEVIIAHYGLLEDFKKHFENKEKLVKLDSWELEAKKAIEKAINKEDNMNEKLTDWQEKLKALDPALDDTVINDAWKNKWGGIKNHSKIADVEKLIKKIIGSDSKVKQEFIDEVKKSDATLVDLKTILGKDPKDIISYIARFEYDQLDDSATEEKDKQKTQKRRRIAKKLNKTNESELADNELNDSLYKIEVGEMTIDAKFYKSDLTEITTETPNEDPQNQDGKMSVWKEWFGFGSVGKSLLAWGMIVVVLLGLGYLIWWDNIKNWWNPKDEPTTDKDEEDEKEGE